MREGEGGLASPPHPAQTHAFLLTDASLREFSNFLKNLEEQREIMVSIGDEDILSNSFQEGSVWAVQLGWTQVLMHLVLFDGRGYGWGFSALVSGSMVVLTEVSSWVRFWTSRHL